MPVLFDSSVYISAMRLKGNPDFMPLRWLDESPVWLSSIVLEELYAGADRTSLRLIEKLERDFERVQRILTPSAGDWAKAGRLLNRLAQKHGFERIGRARMANDALIATSAARTGTILITANKRDFARLAEFCALQWQTSTLP
ncbi:MAG TPA: type II toxin-antitoxin system VapC family toxin [Acidobacteriaceae bacterium]